MYSFTINVRRRHLALALVLLLIGVWISRTDVADAGGSPPGTGIAVVYIAVGTGFADALGAGPGAGLNGAPIILVPTNPPLDPDTSAELIRLDPRSVIIIGGTSAVSTSMENALVALLPNADVSRIAGTNRYKTNAAFSAATFPIEGWVSVPAAAFTSTLPATQDVHIGIGAWHTTGGTLNAPIHLPHGAEILEFRIDAHDANGSDDLTAFLYRVDSISGELTIAVVGTTGDTGSMMPSSTSIEPGLAIVDNGAYGYMVYLNGAAGSDRQIITAMVRYRLGASSG